MTHPRERERERERETDRQTDRQRFKVGERQRYRRRERERDGDGDGESGKRSKGENDLTNILLTLVQRIYDAKMESGRRWNAFLVAMKPEPVKDEDER